MGKEVISRTVTVTEVHATLDGNEEVNRVFIGESATATKVRKAINAEFPGRELTKLVMNCYAKKYTLPLHKFVEYATVEE